MTPNVNFKVMELLTIDALDVLCAQLSRNLFAIAKFLVFYSAVCLLPLRIVSHSGVTNIMGTNVQWLVGLLTFLLPWVKQNYRAYFLPFHVFFGVMTFIFVIASAFAGMTQVLTSRWVLKPLECRGNYNATSNNMKYWCTGRWCVGCYIWYSEQGTGCAAARLGPSSLYQM